MKHYLFRAKRTAVFCVSVFLLLQAWTASGYTQSGEDSDVVQLSEDQLKLVRAFGYPDIFTVIDVEGLRSEVWTYYEWERNFVFLNGIFQRSMPQKGVSPDIKWPTFRPTQFKLGMTESDIREFLDSPTVIGRLTAEQIKDYEPDAREGIVIYNYYEQLKVAFKDGKVVYVQTLPVAVE